ncbi:AP2 domain-containing protein [Staphylococcus chromogenes]|uniref:AP2 domain-containing protein n=1 Tax=Staphylococcus chromogenes TaxID=46126 RepID=UPI0029048364|nr:AP2 domain-containing protein [Staphylococcus chromogenes]MDU0429224.1 AP2 domain-containing protein [Staphylococcus chromogenes]
MKIYKSGEVINHLKILFETDKDKHGRRQYKCLCTLCGSETLVKATNITTGEKTSCGCDTSEKISKANTKHGGSNKHQREYNSWLSIKTRCYNPNHHAYHRYGGRGIKMDNRWLNSFENFLNDMGKAPTKKHQIDRINNDSDYTKDNCRWVTPKENAHNRKVYINKTGYTGVVYKNHIQKYQATYYANRKQVYVGVYDTPEKAYNARIKAIKAHNKTLSDENKIPFLEINEMENTFCDIV